MSVHTLYYFDLYRDWAMYAHPDFHLQHDFLLKELPTRRVNYFPESAYWVTADISVPAFLPEYVVARLNDIQGLASDIATNGLPAMNGHVMFTSGHEWGYWMTDYLTAKMLWNPTATVDSLFADYASSYGSCADGVASTLSQFTALQTKYLFDDRLAPYVMGEDATVDLGYETQVYTIPRRVQFEDVVAMGPGGPGGLRGERRRGARGAGGAGPTARGRHGGALREHGFPARAVVRRALGRDRDRAVCASSTPRSFTGRSSRTRRGTRRARSRTSTRRPRRRRQRRPWSRGARRTTDSTSRR